jgi:hypothetical protein
MSSRYVVRVASFLNLDASRWAVGVAVIQGIQNKANRRNERILNQVQDDRTRTDGDLVDKGSPSVFSLWLAATQMSDGGHRHAPIGY